MIGIDKTRPQESYRRDNKKRDIEVYGFETLDGIDYMRQVSITCWSRRIVLASSLEPAHG